MKIKELLILASVLLAPVSTSLSAKENITGAFGVKLGQTLSSQMIKTSELKFTYEGDDRYSFSPDKKFRSFSTYTIKITPKTRKIYSISAKRGKNEHDDSTCEKEQALIMAIIKKKYWEIEQQFSPIYFYGEQVINQGNRSVAIQCFGINDPFAEKVNYDWPLGIVYLDSKLAELAENARIAAENERIALERSKVIKEYIMFILSIIFFAISAIICWRVDREKCKSLKTYLAKILVGVAAFSGSIACLAQIMDEEEINFILSIMFFTVGAIICWRVDREKCKSLKTYLAKILIGVTAFSVSIACLIETKDEEFTMFMLSIVFFYIGALICWRVDREKCKTLQTYLAKILIGVAALSGSIACLVQIRDEEFIKFILSIMFFTIGAIICWRVDREKCKTLEAYLAKILIGVVVCSISIACVIGMDMHDAEGPTVILSIIFFAIGAIICWRVDREKCKTLEVYLAKILIGVIAFSISITSVIRLIMAL